MNKQTRIALRKGLKNDLPQNAPLGEPLFCTDTGEIYVGMGENSPLKPIKDLATETKVNDVAYKSKNINCFGSNINEAFEKAMQSSYNVFCLDEGVYITSKPLIMKPGSTLIMNPKTEIQPNANFPVLKMTNGCKVYNGTLNVYYLGKSYTSSVVKYDGDSEGYIVNSVLDNVTIKGQYGIGSKGIEMVSSGNNTHVMYNAIQNVYITGFAYGVYTNGTNEGFVSGNVFEGRIFGCTTLINLKGVTGGNTFNMMLQAGIRFDDNEGYGIYCEGSYNVFMGHIWDISQDSPGQTKLTNRFCKFTPYATANVVFPRPINGDGISLSHTIIDEGRGNSIGNLQVFQGTFLPSPNMSVPTNTSSMIGDQDDCFAYLDKNTSRFKLTSQPVECVETNNMTYNLHPSHKFMPNNKGSHITFQNMTTANITYTIECLQEEIFQSIGVSFGSCRSDLQITLINSSNEILFDTTLLKEEKWSSQYPIKYVNLSLLNISKPVLKTVKYVKIKFSNPSATSFGINRIFATSSSGGESFLRKDGGNVLGDVCFPYNTGCVLKSPNGNSYRLKVDDTGNLSTIKL